MPAACDIYGTVHKGATTTILARIVDNAAANVTQSAITSGTYSIFLLDDDDVDVRTAIANHQDVSLTVASVIFDTLQTDARWTVDATGYNFRHTIDVSTNEAFTIAGRNYLVEYLLTPTSGQVIIVRAKLACV